MPHRRALGRDAGLAHLLVIGVEVIHLELDVELPRGALEQPDPPRADRHQGKQPRLAIEFRHPSWHRDETFALLEARGVAYCVMSGANLPCVLRATAPFVYIRLHGPDPSRLYGGSYSENDLRWWADRINEWAAQGRDVFAYFNNDGHGYAVHNAETLIRLLSSRG